MQAESLLAFESGYEERIQSAALGSLSRQLIDAFQAEGEFRLSERTIRMIDGNELAEFLGWEKWRLSREINNLVRRHILVHADHLYVRWSKSRTEALQLIDQLEQDVSQMLLNIPDQQALFNGQRVTFDIETLYRAKKIRAVPLHLFTRFIAALSKSNDSQLQLFARFERDLSGPYELRLRSAEQFKNTSKRLFQRLRQVLQRYAPVEQNEAWHVLDMLFEEANYERRSLLKQLFQLLKKLELIAEETLQQTDIALQIIFKQDDVSAEQLRIDLSRLRLVESHNERKLELMKAFATMPFEQRMPMIKAYFEGAIPLLEPFKMRTDLTEHQQNIVKITEGFHLVRGPAGSGKTTILKEHVRYLIEHKLVPQDRILVVTHYKGAIERIDNEMEIYQKEGKTVAARTLNKLGESIFRKYRELLLRPDGQPYYAEMTELRLQGNSEYEELQRIREALALIWQQGLYANRTRQSALSEENCLKAIQRLRQQGIFPDGTIDNEMLCYLLNSDDKDWVNFMYAVSCQYFLLLGENGIYTYDDQILFALTILNENPEIVKPYQHRYEHIIIDEFQDFTPAQSKLVAILSQKHQNVVAFGDDGQDIRVKKGVDRKESFLEKRFKGISGDRYQVRNLKTNFRSVQEILDLAGVLRNDMVQEAARGLRGEKPVVIRVSLNTSSFFGNVDVHAALKAMVDVALDQVSLLPQIDKGSVALMTAKADQAQIVQHYLRSRQIPFHLLGNSRYQSRHIQRILAYFRLIVDSNQDAEVERLVSSCITPNFDFLQMRRLKEITQYLVEPLIDTITESEILKQINASSEQIEALWQHIAIIYSFVPESLFGDVWQAIAELQNGPLSSELADAQQQDELDELQNQFKDVAVAQALKDVDSCIAYLEEHRAYQQMIVTTIDNAKSQAFDTVFLLRAQELNIDFPNHRTRLYVSVSRARQRFFFLIDERANEAQDEDKPLLSWLRRELGDELSWLTLS
ncbi:MAG TPA: ATP-dependent helicase [Ktedonobacteraceae bacterium]|nr:ATP-dependent helicase [Ktedonobacteraceae bacterium]